MTSAPRDAKQSNLRLTPWPQAEAKTEARRDRLRRAKTRLFGLAAVIAGVWYVGWNILLRVIPPPFAGAVIAFPASQFWWVYASLLTGLGLAAVRDGADADEARTRRIRRRVTCFIVLVATLFALLLRDAYVAFGRDAMSVSDFWTLGSEYRRPYSEVRRVRLTFFAHGRRTAGWALHVRYAWGLPWNSEDGIGETGLSLDELQRAGAFVAARAGVPFEDESRDWIEAFARRRAARQTK